MNETFECNGKKFIYAATGAPVKKGDVIKKVFYGNGAFTRDLEMPRVILNIRRGYYSDAWRAHKVIVRDQDKEASWHSNYSNDLDTFGIVLEK